MYPLISVPDFFKGDFFSLTKAEARQYLHWFLSIKNERIKVLQSQIKNYHPDWVADYSKRSLEDLYNWFKHKVAYRKMSIEEQQAVADQLSKTPLFVGVIPVPTQVFTDETVSICFDFAIYFGEVVITHSKAVTWSQQLSSKKFIDYGQPLITKLGIKVPVNPRRIAEGYARRILEGRSEKTLPIALFETLVEEFKKVDC